MKTILKALILLVMVSNVSAETFQEMMYSEPSGLDVCELMPEYGKMLLGSNCFDWSNCPECRMFCILDGERFQVWSNAECQQLRNEKKSITMGIERLTDGARRADGSLYRYHWCAAHCTLGLELPYDCADWSCN